MAYQAITFAQLKARLQARYESVPFWTEAEAGLAINEALLLWGLLTGRWKRRVQIATTAGNFDYGLPASLVFNMRVAWNEQPLSPASLEDFDNGRPNWRIETTASGGDVPTQPTLWAPVSLALIYIWPADADGHNSLTVDGVSATPQLVLDADYVDLAEADLSVLLGCALHLVGFKKGGPWFQATLPYFVAFLRAAAEENSLITTSQAYRRFMGLFHRDFNPLSGAPSSVDQLAQQALGQVQG